MFSRIGSGLLRLVYGAFYLGAVLGLMAFTLSLASPLPAASAAPASSSQPIKMEVFSLTTGYYMVQAGNIIPFPPSGPIVPPDDPDDPVVPPPVSEFSKRVVAAVNALPMTDKRHQNALKATAVYQMLSGQVRDGKIHPANASQAANLICPIALGADGRNWRGVFSVVEDEVAKATDASVCANTFDSAAVAIASTVPAAGDGDFAGAAERYGFDWDAFLAFLMELLLKLLPLIIS